MQESSLMPVDRIDRAILLIRGEKVLLDSQFACVLGLYNETFNRHGKTQPTPTSPSFYFLSHEWEECIDKLDRRAAKRILEWIIA